ncbi:MAG: hypothetical protein CMD33_08700 [Flavobacteriales bacterium]|nr:hypothetical protein [Crocinitomicaceae bacterium]MBO75338.1 hypothetical protein [Flavobacteriales bacterium]
MHILDQYLHPLFLDHDCIVVPGLGGFVCNRQPAHYDEGRQELTPPYRSVLFNERLVHHDGVLAQAVSRAKGITLDQAVKEIELEVAQLKTEISGDKTVAIEGVGRLYKGKNERVKFLADEQMERMLRSFGLRNIPLRPIAASTPKQPIPQPPKGKVITMPTPSVAAPLARIAAVLAVPVLGGLGMFVADSWEGQDVRMSAINVPEVVAAFEPRFEGEAVPSWDDIQALEEAVPVDPEIAVALERPTTHDIGVPAALDENPGLYMLVAGAFSVEANAHLLANELAASGFDAEVFEQDGGLHIVTYATHLEEQSARMHLEELRKQRISQNAWLKPWKVIQ